MPSNPQIVIFAKFKIAKRSKILNESENKKNKLRKSFFSIMEILKFAIVDNYKKCAPKTFSIQLHSFINTEANYSLTHYVCNFLTFKCKQIVVSYQTIKFQYLL